MLGFHPANLAFRFLLELGALVGIGVGTFQLTDPPSSLLVAVAAPVAAAIVWGRYNVPGDRSRSGEAPVPVRGRVRLTIELVILSAGVLLLAVWSPILALILGAAVVAHYLLSLDRIRWLLAH